MLVGSLTMLPGLLGVPPRPFGVFGGVVVSSHFMRRMRLPVRILGLPMLVRGPLVMLGRWMFSHIGSPFFADGGTPPTP